MLRSRGRFLGFLSLAIMLMSSCGVLAADVLPDVVVFYREGCNDCRQMDAVLDELHELYPGIVIAHIAEQSAGAADLMWALAAKYGIFPSKFPVIFAGDQGFVGSGLDKELLLRSTVRNCVFNDCPSPLERVNEKPFPWVLFAALLVAVLAISVWMK